MSTSMARRRSAPPWRTSQVRKERSRASTAAAAGCSGPATWMLNATSPSSWELWQRACQCRFTRAAEPSLRQAGEQRQ